MSPEFNLTGEEIRKLTIDDLHEKFGLSSEEAMRHFIPATHSHQFQPPDTMHPIVKKNIIPTRIINKIWAFVQDNQISISKAEELTAMVIEKFSAGTPQPKEEFNPAAFLAWYMKSEWNCIDDDGDEFQSHTDHAIIKGKDLIAKYEAEKDRNKRNDKKL